MKTLRNKSAFVPNSRRSLQPFGRAQAIRLHLLFAVLLGCFFAPADTCSAGAFTFVIKEYLPVNAGVQHVAVADLNGDSNPDFVAPDGSGNVWVFLGLGNGRFAPPQSYSYGGYDSEVVVGDFNKDGAPDLALVSGASITILFNDGTGAFETTASATADGSPFGLAAGDVNGDGNLDLVAVNSGASDVSVILGDGAGGFAPPMNFPAGDLPVSVAIGEFTGDTAPDLAISTYSSQEVFILKGDGTGRFVTINSYPIGGSGAEILAGDFNNDQHLDLAVGYYNSDNHIDLFIGDGNGNFTLQSAVPVGDVHGLTAADFNGDGNLDLAGATYFGGAIVVATGDGTGHFNRHLKYSLRRGALPIDVAFGDFDRDGRPDLVTADFGTDDVALLFNR